MHLMLWIICLFASCPICLSTDPRKKGYVDGEIIIGALFPIHEQPTIERTYTRECGKIRETYGMHRVEVLLKTINEINNNSNILPPGISLGVDIRDTCWYVPIALEQSIDFIKNSLAYQQSMQNTQHSKESSEDHSQSRKAIAGLIGPGDSTVTVQVQNLLQLFKIPQISYSATSIDLSKKELYKYFMRVVPSDMLQTKALVDLIEFYKWEYISLVNTQGQYGSQGIKELLNIMKNKDICQDQMIEIDNNEEFHKVIEKARKLFDKDRAKVIVCFCQGETVKQLFQAMVQLNKINNGFLIIGTDGWADRNDILGTLTNKENGERGLSRAALGGISMRLHSLAIPGFDEYFRSKNYSNSPGNPWFQEFWEQTFECRATPGSLSNYPRLCHGNESLFNVDYVQDSKLGFVVKSVMTVAYGLRNLHKKLCSATDRSCLKRFHLNGTALLEEMLNVSFQAYDNETVRFDSKGDPPGRYDIMNYQRHQDEVTGRLTFRYQRIGTWTDNVLNIDKDVQWPGTPGNDVVQSFCSAPCNVNEIKEISGNKKCCWQCKKCQENEYIRVNGNKGVCVPCQLGSIPNVNITGCAKVIPTFILWSYATSIISVIFSCIGIITTSIVIAIFAQYNNTPIVKSSTRELSYAILVGIILCYATTFPLLWKPTKISCLLTRVMPGMSFALIFGALVTKTNRICRILATSKKKIIRRKGLFLTIMAQIVITIILNIVEMVIIGTMIFLEPPAPTEIFPSWNRTQLICNNSDKSVFIPFGFDAVLVCLCTWYAFKTRNLPENFNEAKYIGVTMYTTCIIWIGLIPIYFGAEYRIISMSFAINLSATTALVLLFFPKVYIILVEPERNDRSAFTTTSDIRCHIGPGKGNHQHSTDRQKKFSLESRTDADVRRTSGYITGIYDYSSGIRKMSNFMAPVSSTADISIQTESILILDGLSQVSNNSVSIHDDIRITQMALLHFLDENWNNREIHVTATEPRRESMVSEPHGIQRTSSDTEDDCDDERSVMYPIHGDQVKCASPHSPLSNDSTEASSIISTLFLEYLNTHKRNFSKNKNNRSIIL